MVLFGILAVCLMVSVVLLSLNIFFKLMGVVLFLAMIAGMVSMFWWLL